LINKRHPYGCPTLFLAFPVACLVQLKIHKKILHLLSSFIILESDLFLLKTPKQFYMLLMGKEHDNNNLAIIILCILVVIAIIALIIISSQS
jgi:hypothetical protein